MRDKCNPAFTQDSRFERLFNRMLSVAEIESRKPVWSALSELWLDTELTEHDLNHIASAMARSKYSLRELRAIYLYEVAPVVYSNLMNDAGEWAGFNEEWLYSEIEAKLRNTNLLKRLLVRLKKPLMTFATERHWEVLAKKVSNKRAGRI